MVDIKNRNYYGYVKIVGVKEPLIFNEGAPIISLIQTIAITLMNTKSKTIGEIKVIFSPNKINPADVDESIKEREEIFKIFGAIPMADEFDQTMIDDLQFRNFVRMDNPASQKQFTLEEINELGNYVKNHYPQWWDSREEILAARREIEKYHLNT